MIRAISTFTELKSICRKLKGEYPDKEDFLVDTIQLAAEEMEEHSESKAISLAWGELKEEFGETVILKILNNDTK